MYPAAWETLPECFLGSFSHSVGYFFLLRLSKTVTCPFSGHQRGNAIKNNYENAARKEKNMLKLGQSLLGP